MRKNLKLNEIFKCLKPKSETNKLLKNINIKKATVPDTVPPKLGKLSANIEDSHGKCNIINKDIGKQFFFRWGKNSIGKTFI